MLIATAGHIDHGKTSLVRALTGTDTDRLPQEKARGVSIDLGFAYDTLDGDSVFGFVDVPGHEKFIRNMLAGVASVEAAMLVVAADDGPMPQTLEHLAILDLLRLTNAVVVISKTDRVDAARVSEVEQAVLELVAATNLRQARSFAVSATTGDGIAALKSHLLALRDQQPARTSSGRFRLAIDREFTLAGIGSVVTGTVFSGAGRLGDELFLTSAPHPVRVRSLHVQDQAINDDTPALAGDRCALNLAGLQTGQRRARRGDWLVSGAEPEASYRVDALVEVLSSEPRALKHWTPIHVHHGASSLTGRIAPLEGRQIQPGESALAQLVLDQAAFVARHDRFVLRDQSARRTIGGGEILDSFGPAKGRARPERLECLRAMQSPTAEEVFASLIDMSAAGVDVSRFEQVWNLTGDESRAMLTRQNPALLTLQGRRIAFGRQRWQALQDRLLTELAHWHELNAEAFGPSALQLRQAVRPELVRPAVDECIDLLVRSGRIQRIGSSLKLAEHRPLVPPGDQRFWAILAPHLPASLVKPPVVSALAETLAHDQAELEDFLRRCVLRGQLVRVAPNRYFHPHAVISLAGIAEKLAHADAGRLGVRAFRDASGIGRNLSIEVLEYFDALGFTRRLGDVRHIIKPVAQVFGEPETSGDAHD